jgi:hypothetical protein
MGCGVRAAAALLVPSPPDLAAAIRHYRNR